MAHSERLEKLQQQRQALERKIRLEKKRLSDKQRKEDTRRKVIAGALALKHAEMDSAFKAKLFQLFNEYVERDDDRALFGLDPLPKGQQTAQVPEEKPNAEASKITGAS